MKKLDIENRQVVENFLVELNPERPFPESESYRFMSSHSGHYYKLLGLIGWDGGILHDICVRSENDGLYRDVITDLAKIFVVGYQLSAVYDELNKTDRMITQDYPSGHQDWFHGPFPGGWTTFWCIWNEKERVLGRMIKNSEDLKSDPLLIRAYTAYEYVHQIFKRDFDGKLGRGNPEKVKQYWTEMEKLYAVLKDIFNELVGRVKATL